VTANRQGLHKYSEVDGVAGVQRYARSAAIHTFGIGRLTVALNRVWKERLFSGLLYQARPRRTTSLLLLSDELKTVPQPGVCLVRNAAAACGLLKIFQLFSGTLKFSVNSSASTLF
jgi:hypothetical protein